MAKILDKVDEFIEGLKPVKDFRERQQSRQSCHICGRQESRYLLSSFDDKWKNCVFCGKATCKKCILKLTDYEKAEIRSIRLHPVLLEIIRKYRKYLKPWLTKEGEIILPTKMSSGTICASCHDAYMDIVEGIKQANYEWSKGFKENVYSDPFVSPEDVEVVSEKYKGQKKIQDDESKEIESGWKYRRKECISELVSIAAHHGYDIIQNLNTETDWELITPDEIDDVDTYSIRYEGSVKTFGNGEDLESYECDSREDALWSLKEQAYECGYDVVIDVEYESYYEGPRGDRRRRWTASGTGYHSGQVKIYKITATVGCRIKNPASLILPPAENIFDYYVADKNIEIYIGDWNLRDRINCNRSSELIDYVRFCRRSLLAIDNLTPNKERIKANVSPVYYDSNHKVGILKLNLMSIMPINYIATILAFDCFVPIHIVDDSDDAKEARDVLDKYQINYNSAANGMFICDVGKSLKFGVPKVESLLTKSYYRYLNEKLTKANSRDDAINILYDIKCEILAKFKGK